MISPIPVGIYNIFAPNQYMKVIALTRDRVLLNNSSNCWDLDSKPKELTTMILECQWKTWKDYIAEL